MEYFPIISGTDGAIVPVTVFNSLKVCYQWENDVGVVPIIQSQKTDRVDWIVLSDYTIIVSISLIILELVSFSVPHSKLHTLLC